MASEFKLPELGENVDSGDIVNVLVKEGDEVQADQPVFEIQAGKATLDLPSPQAGKISKVHVKKGATVKVGDALLTFESAGKPAEAKAKPAAAKAAADEAPKPAPERESPKAAPAKSEKPAPAEKPAKAQPREGSPRGNVSR